MVRRKILFCFSNNMDPYSISMKSICFYYTLEIFSFSVPFLWNRYLFDPVLNVI